MEISGIAITLISLILAYQACQSSKLMKQMHVESMVMIKEHKGVERVNKERYSDFKS